MKITDIKTFLMMAGSPALKQSTSWSKRNWCFVKVYTDEGITGIGESDVNPWIARACIEAPSTHSMGLGLREMLIGEDPLDTERLWQKLYVGSCMNGRRGAVINAIGAIDMALWDIRGKTLGLPIYELLGGAVRDSIALYTHPNGGSEPESIAAACKAIVETGHKALNCLLYTSPSPRD